MDFGFLFIGIIIIFVFTYRFIKYKDKICLAYLFYAMGIALASFKYINIFFELLCFSSFAISSFCFYYINNKNKKDLLSLNIGNIIFYTLFAIELSFIPKSKSQITSIIYFFICIFLFILFIKNRKERKFND